MSEATKPGAGGAASLPHNLLEMLVCPLGKAPLSLDGEALVCTKCGLRYAIEDGIPNMMVEEARLPPGVADIKGLSCYPGNEEGPQRAS